MTATRDAFELHGRVYSLPREPTAVICVDGLDPAYLDDALAHGEVPTLRRIAAAGRVRRARAAMPSFTNPNNATIVTGVPPAVHGISGNHFFDAARGEDVPMNRREHLRGDTLLDCFAAHGRRVLAVTAKRKLLALLTPRGGTAFAVEAPDAAGAALLARAGYAAPVPIYSAEASLAVLDAGLAAIEAGEVDVAYLSTTDYVQHKHGPGPGPGRAFVEALDARLARLEALGIRYVLTADHGMNDKTDAAGAPRVCYLEAALARAEIEARITLPITDPYVAHHGALGGAAWVDVAGEVDAARDVLASLDGVEAVYPRDEAAARLALPAERIGDLVVLGDRGTALGRRPDAHDLSEVATGLRSHGSAYELAIAWVASAAVADASPSNADAFAHALAG